MKKSTLSYGLDFFNLLDLILELQRLVKTDTKIDININDVKGIPYMVTFDYLEYESKDEVIYTTIHYFISKNDKDLIPHIQYDKLPQWIKDNPEKVEKIRKLKVFI